MIDQSLRAIARALGGEVSGQQVLAPGPSHGARDRSLAIKISASSPEGFLCHSFARDDFRTCRDYVKSRLGMAHFDPPERPTRPANPHYQKAQIERANEIWRAAIDPRETLVETYLRGRGLELLDELAGHVARFHPACPFGQGQHHPCMVTLFRDIASGKPVAIQRTALRPDGGKIGRKMMASTAGACIKLSDDADVLYGLHLAEGFESALAAWQCGFRPIWAAGSKGSIASFPVLPEPVQSITILMEPDAVAEVEVCAHRWHAAGREAIIVSATAKDMNDAIVEASP